MEADVTGEGKPKSTQQEAQGWGPRGATCPRQRTLRRRGAESVMSLRDQHRQVRKSLRPGAEPSEKVGKRPQAHTEPKLLVLLTRENERLPKSWGLEAVTLQRSSASIRAEATHTHTHTHACDTTVSRSFNGQRTAFATKDAG